MFPDELPKHAADAHLVFGGEFVAGVNRVFKVGKGAVADGLLPDLVAEVHESGSRGRIVALDDDLNDVFQRLVVVEHMYWICVVVHNIHVRINGANLRNFRNVATFFAPLLINALRFLYFCTLKQALYGHRIIDSLDCRRGSVFCALGSFAQGD